MNAVAAPSLARSRESERLGPARGAQAGAVLVVTLGVVLSVSLVAGWLGVSPWGTQWLALVTLAGSLACAALALRWAQSSSRPKVGEGGLLLGVPALSVVGTAILGAMRPAGVGVEWFLGGDHTRHAVYVADTWWQGSLSYELDGYPRGWHAALATIWEASGRAGLNAEGLLALTEIMAGASLLLSAVLALATAHLGQALAARLGLGGRLPIAVGVLAGCLTLLNFSLANYQALGYENSLLAAVVLAVCGREAVVRAGSPSSLVVCAAGTVVIAHAWQLLLPAVAVPALWCTYRALRSPGTSRRTAVLLVPLVLALGGPAVLAVLMGVGIDHASEEGPDSPVPTLLLVSGLVAASAAAWWQRRNRAVVVVAAMTVLPAALAVVLALALDLELARYYPSKLLWQSTVLGLVWVSCAAAMASRAVVRTWPGAGRVVMGTALVLVTSYCVLLPWGSQLGIWSSTDGDRVLSAVTTPGSRDATVVWLEATPTTDSATRSLLDVLRVDRTRERAPQARMTVEDECALLVAAQRPVVLSTAAQSAVRDRYGCIADLEVIAVVSR